ncbi:MAG: T9SS type A sorting domain-containing protein [Bacteroidia bacterium]|nr:MAG: T9SS type A sorting domain-containing protein [Bacteroidia bacterium]
MQKILLTAALAALGLLPLQGQAFDTLRTGIHQAESEYYSGILDRALFDDNVKVPIPSRLKSAKGSLLSHKVYGWHPYWAAASAYLSYDYDALTHIAYFSYEVDTATGGYSTLRGWNTTPLIDYAHQRNVKVTLTVTNFGTARNVELLSDSVKQRFLFTTLVQQLKSRNGDGVNFDLESVPASQKANMVEFCRRAVRMIKAELPQAEISLATPAVDWSSAWDYRALSGICDYLIVMGYNYYWSGSSTAGPVAPLTGETYNVTRSVDTYLNAGVPPEKLLLGVPWYGYDWPVVSSERKAATTGTGTSRFYNAAKDLASTYGKTFDQATGVPWSSYSVSSQWRQLWYDDSLSLTMKNDLVKSKNLGGIGIWALSYQGTGNELWRSIKASYSSAAPEICQITKIVPNPVTGEAVISYSVPSKGHVTMKLIDISGNVRAVLVNHDLEPGFYDQNFNCSGFSDGIYICVLQTPSGRVSKKIAVLKSDR